MNPVNGPRVNWRPILIVGILSAIVCGGILVYQYLWPPKEENKLPEGKTSEEVTKDKTTNWKTYVSKKKGYEVKYPQNVITLSKEGERIVMTHSIPYKHRDPCDFRGEAAPLETLTDFEISIEVSGRNLRRTIIANESDYLVSNFLLDSQLKLEPSFIDSINIGSLEGYRIAKGVEGCGEYTYYFPITTEVTLVVSRSFITELKPITVDYAQFLNLPGVISPSEEEKLFNQILSTFRLLE